MTSPARVQAIDVLQVVFAALHGFQEEATAALDELQLEVNRAIDWIHNDVREYWKAAERRAWQQIAEARVQLEQARTFKRVAEHEPACREEKKALERAQRRLEITQEKLESQRHWVYTIERAVMEFRAESRQLSGWLEGDLPRGLGALRHMITALEAYVALHGPDVAPPPLTFALPSEENEAASATDVPSSPAAPDASIVPSAAPPAPDGGSGAGGKGS